MGARPATRTLLGGQTPHRFLSTHWQKQPLLVRHALPDFRGLVTPAELMRLAQSREAQARVVLRTRGHWQVREGPFSSSDFHRLPERGWTLLVHDVNNFLPQARELLSQFAFVPYARLDDLMISYAAPGGGVGPHLDSYDVFLLQGPGSRRWRIGRQADRTLIENAPLKLLRHFRPEEESVVHAGDLLYLPPEWGHDGVALTECMTYSIGFRAPAWDELTIQFLRFLEDGVPSDGLYRDPGLQPARRPARIGNAMLEQVARRFERIRWHERDVLRFLGGYLTEPKAHVFFTAPRAALPLDEFAQQAHVNGVTLNLKSEMLYKADLFFINGETVRISGSARDALTRLADERQLDGVDMNRRGLVSLLHEWYSAGYLRLRKRSSRKTGLGQAARSPRVGSSAGGTPSQRNRRSRS